ncbi:hypothetical protein Lal_00015276 [Lupinus albus]|nr:hypothetical protein Lal_00015276 [Lupinus albus]
MIPTSPCSQIPPSLFSLNARFSLNRAISRPGEKILPILKTQIWLSRSSEDPTVPIPHPSSRRAKSRSGKNPSVYPSIPLTHVSLSRSSETLSPKRESGSVSPSPGLLTHLRKYKLRVLHMASSSRSKKQRSNVTQTKQETSSLESIPLDLTRLLANYEHRKVFEEHFHGRTIFTPKFGNVGNFEFEEFLFPYLLRQQHELLEKSSYSPRERKRQYFGYKNF